MSIVAGLLLPAARLLRTAILRRKPRVSVTVRGAHLKLESETMSLLSRLFTRDVPKGVEEIETLGSELAGEIDKMFERSLLDKCASAIDAMLAEAKSEMASLKAEIADREAQIGDRLEKVRHASVVVDAFGAAQKLLEAGYDKKPDAPVATDPVPASAGLEPVL